MLWRRESSWVRRETENIIVEGFGIEDDRGRGSTGRATSIGGRGDPEASRWALPGFRMVGFPARGGGRRLREGEAGAGRRAPRRAVPPVSAAVRVAHGR